MNSKKRRNKKRKHTAMYFTFLFSLSILASLTYKSFHRIVFGAPGILEGVEKIKELEALDLAAIQKEISAAEAAANKKSLKPAEPELSDPPDSAPVPAPDFKNLFSDSIIIGDSITEAILDYDFLYSSSVIAKRGIGIGNSSEETETLIRLSPKHIFFAFGMNDLEYFNGDAERFQERYKQTVLKIQTQLPETKIYMNSILPIQDSAIRKKPVYSNIAFYNQKIQELCLEMELVYIDNGSLLSELEDIYEKDGIHIKPSYYPLWLKHMSEKAGF